MRLAVIGVSYKEAPVEIRDHAAFTDTGKMELYDGLSGTGVKEAVILSTCNRSEIYFLYQKDEHVNQVIRLYDAFFGYPPLEEYVFVKKGEEALRYLFRVTSGLDSMVLGEDQILGQVVAAEEFARENGCSKKLMNRIFRDAVTCAKKARTLYRISEVPLSLSYIAMKQLGRICGIEGKEILVLGSGKMSNLALKYLYEENPKKIYVANRSRERAESLRKEFPALSIVDFKERYQALAHCDILISATASPHVIIRKEELLPREKELYVVDLASPRDIDPALHEEEQVQVFDMDYLNARAEENNKERLQRAYSISNMIEEYIPETEKWVLSSRVDTTIQTLQERMDEVSEDAYRILERKLDITEHEKAIVKKVLKTSMKRLLREPILSLKQLNPGQQEHYHEVVKDLFHLE